MLLFVVVTQGVTVHGPGSIRTLDFLGDSVYGECSGSVLVLAGGVLSWSAV